MKSQFCAFTVKLSPFMEMNFHQDNVALRISGANHPYSIHLPLSKQTDAACQALSNNSKAEISIIDQEGTSHHCHIASISHDNSGLVLLTEP